MLLRDFLKSYTTVKCVVCSRMISYKNHYNIDGQNFCFKCYVARMASHKKINTQMQNKLLIEMKIDGVSTDKNGYAVITGRKIFGDCLCGDTLIYRREEFTVLHKDVKAPLHTGPFPIFALTLDTKETLFFKIGDSIQTCRMPRKKNSTFICPKCNNYTMTRFMSEDGICDKCDARRKRADERNGKTTQKAAPVINDTPKNPVEPITEDLSKVAVPPTVELPDIEVPTILESEGAVLIGADSASPAPDVTSEPNSAESAPIIEPYDIAPDHVGKAEKSEGVAPDMSDASARVVTPSQKKIRERAARYAPYMPNTVRAQLELLKNLSAIMDVSCVTSSDKISWDFSGRTITHTFRDQFEKDLGTLILLIEESLTALASEGSDEILGKIGTASEEELLKASVSLEFYLSSKHAPHVAELLENVYAELSSRE